ncbi:MAG: nucleotidyltransferase family protein [Nanoarchaeota archaeon]|nr:nucleotidyltransferase family protein [Nanoarchaeota archaeon]
MAVTISSGDTKGKMRAVILAAGEGTRLLPYTRLVPKPLMPIETNARGMFATIIERLIRQVIHAGIRDIAIVIGYKGDMIEQYLGDGSAYSCRLTYYRQERLDGNAGALFSAEAFFKKEDILVLDSDNFFRSDKEIKRLTDEFLRSNPDILVGVGAVENTHKYAILKTDSSGKPVDIVEKPKDASYGNLAKSGAMIASNSLLAEGKGISKASEGEYTTTNIIKHAIFSRKRVELHEISFTDTGTWEDYISLLRDNI